MRNVELEREASYFAMCLLMPKKFIEQDIEAGIDLCDDNALKELAKKYQVPMNALMVRIALLKKHKI